MQVPVIDSDEFDVQLQRPIEFLPVMNFNQNIDGEVIGEDRQLLQLDLSQRRHNQQYTVGPQCLRLGDLIRVDHEVFANYR